MEKKNDMAGKANEMTELTLDQMDKVSGGTGGESPDIPVLIPLPLPEETDPIDRPDILRIITLD